MNTLTVHRGVIDYVTADGHQGQLDCPSERSLVLPENVAKKLAADLVDHGVSVTIRKDPS